jgi:hemolysin activation/secretion protein
MKMVFISYYAVLQNLAASLFYDAGSINVNANPYMTTSNERSLSGAGIGLAGNFDAFDWRLTLAWRNGDPSTSEPDKSPRFWAQAGWRF